MKMKIILPSSFLGLTLSCAHSQNDETPKVTTPIHHELVPHPDDPNKRMEYYWAKPEGNGPWPVMVYIHGFQEGDHTPGGRDMVDYHVLEKMTAKGVVAVSISQAGFGEADGPRDDCELTVPLSFSKNARKFPRTTR